MTETFEERGSVRYARANLSTALLVASFCPEAFDIGRLSELHLRSSAETTAAQATEDEFLQFVTDRHEFFVFVAAPGRERGDRRGGRSLRAN